MTTTPDPPRRVALILFTEPFLFPPTLHAASLLAERGWEVDLIGLRIASVPQGPVEKGVKLVYFDRVRKGVALRIQFARFLAWCAFRGRSRRYRTVIGYDIMGAAPAWCAARAAGAKLVYHNHDLVRAGGTKGLFYGAVKKAEMAVARGSDAVVFPQAERARIFWQEAGLRTPPFVVFNCPRRNWLSSDAAKSPAWFSKWKQNVGDVVLYQGGLLRHRGLFALIDSMTEWKFKGGLCMVGLPLEPGIVEAMEARAREIGVADRFLIWPPLPHDELAGVTASATVGIGVINAGGPFDDERHYVNLLHLAGASNKIFEYMAAGLPIVSPRGGGFEALIREPEHGVCFDAPESGEIAAALNRLYSGPDRLAQIAKNNRDAFVERYNYDVQFRPIVDLIEA